MKYDAFARNITFLWKENEKLQKKLQAIQHIAWALARAEKKDTHKYVWMFNNRFIRLIYI